MKNLNTKSFNASFRFSVSLVMRKTEKNPKKVEAFLLQFLYCIFDLKCYTSR